jgi:hypothetical protein
MPARTNPLTARFGATGEPLVATLVLHLLNSFERCEDFRCLTWRTVGQSPWTARDPLVALPLAITQPSIVWLRLRCCGLHLFKFFAAREDFTALVERASKPATPTFWLRLRRFVGRAILPAAAFQAALWRGLLIFAAGHRRLRPGASQDRLPPSSNTGILARFSRQVSSLGARSSRKLVRNAG